MRWNCILLAILHKNQKVKCLRRGNQNTTIWEFNKVGWTLFWAFFATMFAYCQSREVAPCCKIYKKFTIFSAFAPCKGGFFYCMHRESSILIMDSLKDEMEVLFILCLTPMQSGFCPALRTESLRHPLRSLFSVGGLINALCRFLWCGVSEQAIVSRG